MGAVPAGTVPAGAATRRTPERCNARPPQPFRRGWC